MTKKIILLLLGVSLASVRNLEDTATATTTTSEETTDPADPASTTSDPATPPPEDSTADTTADAGSTEAATTDAGDAEASTTGDETAAADPSTDSTETTAAEDTSSDPAGTSSEDAATTTTDPAPATEDSTSTDAASGTDDSATTDTTPTTDSSGTEASSGTDEAATEESATDPASGTDDPPAETTTTGEAASEETPEASTATGDEATTEEPPAETDSTSSSTDPTPDPTEDSTPTTGSDSTDTGSDSTDASSTEGSSGESTDPAPTEETTAPTTTTTTPEDEEDDDEADYSDAWKIIGIVAGCSAVVILIVGAMYWYAGVLKAEEEGHELVEEKKPRGMSREVYLSMYSDVQKVQYSNAAISMEESKKYYSFGKSDGREPYLSIHSPKQKTQYTEARKRMGGGVIPQGVEDDKPHTEGEKGKEQKMTELIQKSNPVDHEKIDLEVGGTGGTKKALDGDSNKNEDVSIEFSSTAKLISGTDLRMQPLQDPQDNLRVMGYKVIETTPSLTNMLPTERLNEQELRETPQGEDPDMLSARAQRNQLPSMTPSTAAKVKKKVADFIQTTARKHQEIKKAREQSQ